MIHTIKSDVFATYNRLNIFKIDFLLHLWVDVDAAAAVDVVVCRCRCRCSCWCRRSDRRWSLTRTTCHVRVSSLALLSISFPSAMAQVRCFTLIADSNVKRFNNLINRRACPELNAAQVLICNKLSLFREAEIRAESDTCIIACCTNFLVSSPDIGSSAGHRVEAALLEFRQLCHELCSSSSDRMVLVSPPMYRSSPLWFRDGLSEVINKLCRVPSRKMLSRLPNK